MNATAPCPFADAVAKAVVARSEAGLRKYGVTCARADLGLDDWLKHLQEELLDAAVYVERIRFDLKGKSA